MFLMRYELTDHERAAMRAILLNKQVASPGPASPQRYLLGLTIGAQWRDLFSTEL
jgi:hypothetical protein